MHRTRPYHFRRIERTAMDRTIVVDAVGVDDETRDDGAIVVDDDDYDERVVDDRVFVRRNNQLARVKEYRGGEEGRGLILVKPTESD